MKYIKKFESESKIGKKVICIDDINSYGSLFNNKIYTIEDIRTNRTPSRGGYNQYKLIGTPFWWDDIRFKIATKKNIEKVLLKQNINKYNL